MSNTLRTGKPNSSFLKRNWKSMQLGHYAMFKYKFWAIRLKPLGASCKASAKEFLFPFYAN